MDVHLGVGLLLLLRLVVGVVMGGTLDVGGAGHAQASGQVLGAEQRRGKMSHPYVTKSEAKYLPDRPFYNL